MFQFRPKPCRNESVRERAATIAVGRGLLLLWMLLATGTTVAQWQLQWQQLSWGIWTVQTLQFQHHAVGAHQHGQDSLHGPLWSLQLQGLGIANAVQLDVRLDCLRAGAHPASTRPVTAIEQALRALTDLRSCAQGEIHVRPLTDAATAEHLAAISGQFSYAADSGELNIDFPALQFNLDADEHWRLQLQALPVAWLHQVLNVAALAPATGIGAAWTPQRLPWPRSGYIDGQLSGQLGKAAAGQAASWQGELRLRELSLDNELGDIAAANVTLQLHADASYTASQQRWDFSLAVQWLTGEWLLDTFYLPAPTTPVRFAVAGSWSPGHAADRPALRLQQLHWQHDQVIDLQAEADWIQPVSEPLPAQHAPTSVPSWLPSRWQIKALHIDLPAFQDAYLGGWLQTRGMAGLIRSGSMDVQSAGAITAQGLQHDSHVQISAVQLLDPGNRFASTGLAADINWRYPQGLQSPQQSSRLAWQSLQIGKLPVATTALTFDWSGASLQLQRDSMIGLLDGGILLHELNVNRMFGADATLQLDAEIVPLSLRQLGQVMGWPEFGGQLSGSIPGVRREHGVWSLDGQIELKLFQGRAVISGLSLERPFGVLPVLQASIWIERLQLAPLTEAFDVGRISGPVDAYIRDLRLLEWRPVSFDAWLHTSPQPQVPLRISQRALDTLSNVGGGIGGGLQASVLRLFESFRYQQLGLSCRLNKGVCQMNGIADAADGHGYVLVMGAGVPHLNVVAYNRLVDWQRLLEQLHAAITSQGAKMQ